MALSDVQICANALVRLGAQPIQSFADESDIATICSTIYPPKKEFFLSKFPWRFTMNYVQLSRLVAAPTAQWSYQYALPADRVQGGFTAVYTSSDVGALPIRDYTIIGNVLMTDETEIWVQYQYNVDESLWPAYFTELMVGVMKAELAILITDNAGLEQQIRAAVYGSPSEGGEGGLVGMTQFLDSRDNPTVAFTDFTLIDARFAGV